MIKKTVMVGPPLRLPELSSTHILLSPVDMAGLPGMAQVLAVFTLGSIPSARVKCGHMEQRLSLLIRLRF